MPSDRFFTEIFPLKEGMIALDSEESHHLKTVVRGKIGEEVEVINGKGELATCTIVSLEKEAKLRVEKVTCEQRFGKRILAQALPRQNRLDTILEKVTELGIDEIWLFPGDKSEKGTLSENALLRAKRILINAMKQCGRLTLPEIYIKEKLSLWKKEAFIGGCYGKVGKAPSFSQATVFFIGPESGFSEKEENLLEENGVLGVSLHENILRVDTAAIVAATLMSQEPLLDNRHRQGSR